VFDKTAVGWQSKKNVEIREIIKIPYITSHVNGQIIQWLGHAMIIKETYSASVAI